MMHILKTVDATRVTQDHKFLMQVCFGFTVHNEVTIVLPFMYWVIIWFLQSQEIKHVLRLIDLENVVQIVTNNGSNFKKACNLLSREYKHIVQQPCLAYTINLMLKDIGKWQDHEAMHLQLDVQLQHFAQHAIDGQLFKWNATRFGTNYTFLESFMRKDKLMVWMMSLEFKHSRFFQNEGGRYDFDNMTNIDW